MKKQRINVITITDVIDKGANFLRHGFGVINSAIESLQQQTLQSDDAWQQPQRLQVMLLYIVITSLPGHHSRLTTFTLHYMN